MAQHSGLALFKSEAADLSTFCPLADRINHFIDKYRLIYCVATLPTLKLFFQMHLNASAVWKVFNLISSFTF